ncbi:Two-component response regulator-like PRR1 [Picochlorum sp. SENEW3]|nr:Two-component response regulator-like PRR1 [Picochlorum sp. SENEW3]
MNKRRLGTDDDAAPGNGAAIEPVPETRQDDTNEYNDTTKKRRVSTDAMADEHDVVLMAGTPGSKHMPNGLAGHVSTASDHRHDMDIPELGQMHVLVVDSDRQSRLKTVGLLQECGYKVLICSRGSAAFEMLVREFDKGVSVDVILKAHEPPVSSAVEFLKRLRSSHKEYTNILVIVYSDRCDDRDAMAECLSLGAVDWWVKPLRRNEVCNIWTRVWQQKHAGQLSAKNAGGMAEKERGADASSAMRLAENKPVFEDTPSIPDGDVHHHHHRHHHHRRYHHHRKQEEEEEEEPPRASKALAGVPDEEMTPGNGSSGKQSGTVLTKKSAAGAAKPPIKKNESSNPSVKSAAADPMDAEVAAALTSMRSHRSNESSDDKHMTPKDAANTATGQQKTLKTEDGSGGSTQFGMQNLMSMPFMPGHPVVNYRQYPFPWPGTDVSKQNTEEGKAQRQAMDFQQAWFNWQQQYHAMQMNYAMQGAQRPFAGNWPPMNVPYSYGGWAAPGIPAKYQKPTFSDASGSRQMASPSMSDTTRSQLARLEAVKKYKEKRTRRKADTSTKIRYKSRKILADARPRVRGQFVQVAKQSTSEQGSNKKNRNESSEQAYQTKSLHTAEREEQDKRVQGQDCVMASASYDKTTHTNNDASVPSQSGRPLASKGGPSDSGSNSPQSRHE